MPAAQFVGLSFAAVHAMVVLWVIWAILRRPEPAWPQYWNLAALTTMPASVVAVALARAACRTLSPRQQITVLELERNVGASPQWTQLKEKRPIPAASRNCCAAKTFAWERVRDIENFQVPLVLLGIGGVAWWYFMPQWVASTYDAVARL
jgi:hypothetical protein